MARARLRRCGAAPPACEVLAGRIHQQGPAGLFTGGLAGGVQPLPGAFEPRLAARGQGLPALPQRQGQRQQPTEEAEEDGDGYGDGDVVVFVREDHEIVPHGQVWEGSVEMARWICAHYHERFRTGSGLVRPRVLELGSGCGLPGQIGRAHV